METETAATRYAIDKGWYAARRKSFAVMVQGRLCAADRARIGTDQEEMELDSGRRVPTVDPASGRMTFQTGRRINVRTQPELVIEQHCSQQRDYITGQQPLLEMVFRLLLARGNTPMTAAQIHQELSEWSYALNGPARTSVEALERAIRADNFYGIQPVAAALPAA